MLFFGLERSDGRWAYSWDAENSLVSMGGSIDTLFQV